MKQVKRQKEKQLAVNSLQYAVINMQSAVSSNR